MPKDERRLYLFVTIGTVLVVGVVGNSWIGTVCLISVGDVTNGCIWKRDDFDGVIVYGIVVGEFDGAMVLKNCIRLSFISVMSRIQFYI